jgi:uncharacterized protein YceK
MKRSLLLTILLSMLYVGCTSFRSHFTALPTGSDKYMQTTANGQEAHVRTLLKADF